VSGSPEATVRLAGLIRAARSVVALTGAGISVPSGIPDFRTPQTGLWAKVDPMQVAHIDVFRRDPKRFWAFYGPRFATLGDTRPNPAHEALTRLEAAGLLHGVITQNIDRLHAAAGTRELVEVHGTIGHAVCPRCGARHALPDVRERIATDPDAMPRCDCGAVLKPGVVLFGEMLPLQAFERAQRLAGGADLMLCIGTSLEVHPVAGLPEMTLAAGGQIAILTQGPTPLDGAAAVRLGGDVVAELGALLHALGLAPGRPALRPD
jgi:NAD-dependent deacetylase